MNFNIYLQNLFRFVLPLLLIYSCLLDNSFGALTYTFNGRGSGSLAQSLFTDAAFSITAQGDETQVFRVENTDVFRLNGVSALLEIAGLGSATFRFEPNISVTRNGIPASSSSIFIGDPIHRRPRSKPKYFWCWPSSEFGQLRASHTVPAC